MPSEPFEIRISFRRLLIGLLATVVPISIAGLWAVSQSNRSLQRVVGNHFSAIAAGAAAETSQFIHERAIDVAMLAADPVVADAVIASNRTYQQMSEPAAAARIEAIDRVWNTAAGEPAVKQMLSSRASQALRRSLELDPRFLRITVTDARGATVAATHKTADYFQADEDYWQSIFAEGRGATSVTDVLHDEVTDADYIGVGVPVVEEGSNRFMGTVDALVTVTSLAPIVNRSLAGSSGRTLIVKEDGTVICGPQITYAMQVKSQEYAAVRDAMTRMPLATGTTAGQQAGYIVADLADTGRQLIAYADAGLKGEYQKPGWMVLVHQDTRQAFAPVRFVDRLLLAMSGIGLALATLLVVYFTLHRRPEVADIRDSSPEAAPAGAGEPVPPPESKGRAA